MVYAICRPEQLICEFWLVLLIKLGRGCLIYQICFSFIHVSTYFGGGGGGGGGGAMLKSQENPPLSGKTIQADHYVTFILLNKYV